MVAGGFRLCLAVFPVQEEPLFQEGFRPGGTGAPFFQPIPGFVAGAVVGEVLGEGAIHLRIGRVGQGVDPEDLLQPVQGGPLPEDAVDPAFPSQGGLVVAVFRYVPQGVGDRAQAVETVVAVKGGAPQPVGAALDQPQGVEGPLFQEPVGPVAGRGRVAVVQELDSPPQGVVDQPGFVARPGGADHAVFVVQVPVADAVSHRVALFQRPSQKIVTVAGGPAHWGSLFHQGAFDDPGVVEHGLFPPQGVGAPDGQPVVGFVMGILEGRPGRGDRPRSSLCPEAGLFRQLFQDLPAGGIILEAYGFDGSFRRIPVLPVKKGGFSHVLFIIGQGGLGDAADAGDHVGQFGADVHLAAPGHILVSEGGLVQQAVPSRLRVVQIFGAFGGVAVFVVPGSGLAQQPDGFPLFHDPLFHRDRVAEVQAPGVEVGVDGIGEKGAVLPVGRDAGGIDQPPVFEEGEVEVVEKGGDLLHLFLFPVLADHGHVVAVFAVLAFHQTVHGPGEPVAAGLAGVGGSGLVAVGVESVFQHVPFTVFPGQPFDRREVAGAALCVQVVDAGVLHLGGEPVGIVDAVGKGYAVPLDVGNPGRSPQGVGDGPDPLVGEADQVGTAVGKGQGHLTGPVTEADLLPQASGQAGDPVVGRAAAWVHVFEGQPVGEAVFPAHQFSHRVEIVFQAVSIPQPVAVVPFLSAGEGPGGRERFEPDPVVVDVPQARLVSFGVGPGGVDDLGPAVAGDRFPRIDEADVPPPVGGEAEPARRSRGVEQVQGKAGLFADADQVHQFQGEGEGSGAPVHVFVQGEALVEGLGAPVRMGVTHGRFLFGV